MDYRIRFVKFALAALIYNLWRLTDYLIKAAIDKDVRDNVESTGYYFEVDNTSDEFTFESLELDYDEAALPSDRTLLNETFSLWRFDGSEWEQIEDSAVDTDRQVVTGNVTEPGIVGVFGEVSTLESVEIAEDPTVDQGAPLEVDLVGATGTLGEPFVGESDLRFGVEAIDGLDEPVDRTVTFEDGEATGVEVLAAHETEALSAGVHEDVEIKIEGTGATDAITVSVEAVLGNVDVEAADDPIVQGDPLEVNVTNAEGMAGDTFDGSVDLTVDDIDGESPDTAGVDVTSGTAERVELFDGETPMIAAGTYDGIEVVAQEASDEFSITVDPAPASGGSGGSSASSSADGDTTAVRTTESDLVIDVRVTDNGQTASASLDVRTDDAGEIDLYFDGTTTGDHATLDRLNVETTSGVDAPVTIQQAASLEDISSDDIEPIETALGTESAGYLSIDTEFSTDVERATFEISVPADRFGDEDHDPSDVTVFRYDDGWGALETTFVEEADEVVTVEATAEGFSTFAVSVSDPGLDAETEDTDGASDSNEYMATDEGAIPGDADDTGEPAEAIPGFGVMVGILSIMVVIRRGFSRQ